jgi:hypothetical protein
MPRNKFIWTFSLENKAFLENFSGNTRVWEKFPPILEISMDIRA